MIRKILTSINIALVIFTILSGFAFKLNPINYWVASFLGMAYPFLITINIFFVFWWFLFMKKKSYALFSVIAIIITWSSFTATFNISAPTRSINDISILTWNVKNFDLYNWSNNEETHELMIKLLEERKPDILCLQEFYTESKGKFKNIKELKKRLGYKYYYFGETFNIKKSKQWGLATFSNFPIKDKGIINFDSGSRLNACIYTDIEIARDSVYRVYNTHLQSMHFEEEDYQYLNELKEERKPDVESTLKIAKKIKRGFVNRASQAIKIQNHKSKFKGRSIICGDFNDTPTSYAYNLLANNMQDAFKAKGFGFGKTWVNSVPFFRIDFVLMDESIKINSYKTIKKEHSDHYPVQVYFE